MKLTGENITDEQIRELRALLVWYTNESDVIACDVALGALRGARLGSRRLNRAKARARCAALINARSKETK